MNRSKAELWLCLQGVTDEVSHQKMQSVVYLIYSPLGTTQPFPSATPDTHIQEAGGLQAVLLAPQQELQPFHAPVGALQRVWNICSEETQAEILPPVSFA